MIYERRLGHLLVQSEIDYSLVGCGLRFPYLDKALATPRRMTSSDEAGCAPGTYPGKLTGLAAPRLAGISARRGPLIEPQPELCGSPKETRKSAGRFRITPRIDRLSSTR